MYESISTENNIINIKAINNKCVSEFMNCLHILTVDKGYSNIIIDTNTETIYPNVWVPIRGIIDFYEKYKNIDIHLRNINSSYLYYSGFITPYSISDIKTSDPFNKIITYKAEDVSQITQMLCDKLNSMVECEKGVIDSLGWCLNEIMDNVSVHSECSYGFIMAQYHPQTEWVAICGYDHGIGIYESMKNSKHRPQNEIESLNLAVQEGIGDGKGQGNGLYGLSSIISQNKGNLNITSGKTCLYLNQEGKSQIHEYRYFLDDKHLSTTIDFQMNLKKRIDMDSIFLKNIIPFKPEDPSINNMYNERTASYTFSVKTEATDGIATRLSGKALRTKLWNLIQRTDEPIIVDFQDCKIRSSSFIDEFLGILYQNIGSTKFYIRLQLKNMDETTQKLLDRAIYLRKQNKNLSIL